MTKMPIVLTELVILNASVNQDSHQMFSLMITVFVLMLTNVLLELTIVTLTPYALTWPDHLLANVAKV